MEGFRFTLPCQVRIADVNYGGHVSNAAVLNLFQDGRIGYLAQLGNFTELDLGGYGTILTEAHVYYRAEMFHGDRLEIGVRVEELRNAAMVMGYRIERDGVPTAEGATKLVGFDYRSRKPVRLPKGFRAAVQGFEKL